MMDEGNNTGRYIESSPTTGLGGSQFPRGPEVPLRCPFPQ